MSKHKKTKAEKQRATAKWRDGVFALDVVESEDSQDQSTQHSAISDSVIFDKNQVRLVYKDIRTSVMATVIVSCLLAGAYAMMRF